ncbi:ABC transporter substrate-binding protein [Mesorhizobium sp. M0913]|uniref:ABC transporter substrate-binding protein n=1 Tax=Mesorhizobium sp. M0913 TaxID=2957026 RepID=UPI00333D4533
MGESNVRIWIQACYRSKPDRRGKISRRDFINLGLAAGLTVTAADKLFVSTARAEPLQGGFAKLGMAHGATTDSIDPAGYPDTFTQTAFSGSMSNSLTEVDAKGNVQPDLAESFESSDGAKTWVFKLRKGASFHNGKNVTADDVVTSLRYHMGDETKSAAKPLLEPVASIKADGPETVVFTLKSGNADFPYIMSDYHLVIMPAKDGKADWGSGVRTGAFVLENFQPGVSAKLKRNPNYFKNGKPYLDEVEFIAITDLAARMAALSTGEVDYIGRADLKTLGMLKRNPKVEIVEVTGYGHYTLPMNVTMAPFDNPDVRMALKWAINRQEIVDKIFLGHATVANDNPIAPAIKFATNPQPQHSFDPEKAKHYLKKGWNGETEGGPLGRRCRFCRRGGRGCADPRDGSPVRYRRKRRARGRGRLLGQCLAQETLVRFLLERSRDGRLDVHASLRRRFQLERVVLEKSPLQRVACRGARRDG